MTGNSKQNVIVHRSFAKAGKAMKQRQGRDTTQQIFIKRLQMLIIRLNSPQEWQLETEKYQAEKTSSKLI